VSTQSVIVTLDAETLERLRAAARSERSTLADVIRKAIRAQLSSAVRTRT
jgi:Ribbon-helix-helix protein, copG family